MNKHTFIGVFCVIISLIALNACEETMDEHYKKPEWLKGSTWEVLESRENYSMFLKGAELAGFRSILEGKSLATVLAPNDSAFKVYLAEKNVSSIEDLSTEELKKLIGFHIMYYSYDSDKLVNFRPNEGDGATEEELNDNAGLYYKHRTRSSDQPTAAVDTSGNEITIYHNERLLPVFSYRMFQTLDIDPVYNYEYFYPDSKWTGDDGFNVSNASVKEYEVVADNGYVYLVDKVVEPLETIYSLLKSRSDYSLYLQLYDRFSYYLLDEQLTTDFGDGTDLYVHYHQLLPNIACEWPVSDYRSLGEMSQLSTSVFAPSNNALNDFFENYWKAGGYNSFSDVNDIAVAYLLYNSVFKSLIIFPEMISDGLVQNSFNVLINFDVDAVPRENRVMCENGAFYGLEELGVPGMFKSITGPAFQNKAYSYYLYMLDASDLLVGLSSKDASFTALIPSNKEMETSGISLIDGGLWWSEEGELTEMSTSAMTNYVDLHTVTGGQEIKSSGTQVLRTNKAFNYWYVKDGKLTTSILFNRLFENPSSPFEFSEINEFTLNGESWSNGRVYSYDNEEIFHPLSSTASVQNLLAITRDETYDFFQFSELLRKSGLVNAEAGTLPFLSGLRCIIFIPRNDVITDAIAAGKIPGVESGGTVSDQEQLANYLKGYFVPTEANGITTYPYLGSGVDGQFATLEDYSLNGAELKGKLIISDDGQFIKVRRSLPDLIEGNWVNVVPDFYYFPFSYDDGGVHFIDGIL
jgi:uncharacterized surface protein with fasciclin (FAS1) repeats